VNESITEQVVQLAAGTFGVVDGSITASSHAGEVEQWDSLAQLSLLVAIEDEFGLVVDPSEVADLPDLGALAQYVADHA